MRKSAGGLTRRARGLNKGHEETSVNFVETFVTFVLTPDSVPILRIEEFRWQALRNNPPLLHEQHAFPKRQSLAD